MKTKERVLITATELFNRNGVGVITTNHIAKAMNISPGNLYFHYDNKEEIIAEIFRRMCRETYVVWGPRRNRKMQPLQFIEENFEIYWKYRFFHREMYALRRKDVKLARMWKQHIQKMIRMMGITYRRWVKSGMVMKISNQRELTYVSESLLAMSTTFLQFFESAERLPLKQSIERGKQHVARLLLPYCLGDTKESLEVFLKT